MTALARTGVVLLAAGRSLRYPGRSKLCRQLNGIPLGLYAAKTIASLAPATSIAVCSERTRELTTDFIRLGFAVTHNDEVERGLSSSIAIGVRAALQHDIDAILICLADMPFVGPSHLRALVQHLNISAGVSMVGSRARHGKVAMPPAVFDVQMADRLVALEGDQGARQLLRQAAVLEVDSKELQDFDTPDDFEGWATSHESA